MEKKNQIMQMFSGLKGEQAIYVNREWWDALREELEAIAWQPQSQRSGVGFIHPEIKFNLSGGSVLVRNPSYPRIPSREERIAELNSEIAEHIKED